MERPSSSDASATSPSATSNSAQSSTPTTATSSPPPPESSKPITSLDLLLAKKFIIQEHTSSPIHTLLETLTMDILTAASKRQWTHPVLSHVVSDFIAEFDHSNGEKIDSFEAYIKHHEKLVAGNPEYKFYPMNASAQVHESNATASVHVLLKVIGHPKNVVRESVVIFIWKRREQVWRCYKHKVIRGMHWNV